MPSYNFDVLRKTQSNVDALSDEYIDDLLCRCKRFSAGYRQAKESGSVDKFLEDNMRMVSSYLQDCSELGAPCFQSRNRAKLEEAYKQKTGMQLPAEGHVQSRLPQELSAVYRGTEDEFLPKMDEIIKYVESSSEVNSATGDALCISVAKYTKMYDDAGPLSVDLQSLQLALANSAVLAKAVVSSRGRDVILKLGVSKRIAQSITLGGYALDFTDLATLMLLAYEHKNGITTSATVRSILQADVSPVKGVDMDNFTVEDLYAATDYIYNLK